MDTIKFLQELSELLQERQRKLEEEERRDHPFFFSNTELKQMLGLSKSTLYRYRRENKLRYHKEGNSITYDYDELMTAIQEARIRIKGMTKLQAMEKLTNYKKLVEQGFDIKKLVSQESRETSECSTE